MLADQQKLTAPLQDAMLPLHARVCWPAYLSQWYLGGANLVRMRNFQDAVRHPRVRVVHQNAAEKTQTLLTSSVAQCAMTMLKSDTMLRVEFSKLMTTWHIRHR